MRKSNLFSAGTNSDAFPEGIWAQVEGKSEMELSLSQVYSLKSNKYPRIFVLLKEIVRTEFGSARAVFHDFTGNEIQAHIHQKAFAIHNSKISIGNLLQLVDVSVMTFDGVKQLFLDAHNIATIIIAKDYSIVQIFDLPQSTQTISSQTRTIANQNSQKPKSSVRLRLSDVQPRHLSNNVALGTQKSVDRRSGSSHAIPLDSYDLLNQELCDDFENY